MPEAAFYQYMLLGAGTLITVGTTIIGWFLSYLIRSHGKKFDTLTTELEQAKLDLIAQTRALDQYKTHVAETYVQRGTMKEAVAEVRKAVEEGLREMREDRREDRQDVKGLRQDIQTLLASAAR